jgi:2-desacetyl-2-hydroxyethyl bacteriochlorophyllide A dehydrogenase
VNVARQSGLRNRTVAAARAVWFAGPRRAELRTEFLPPPADDQVQVESLYSGISHGTEMLVYRGEVDPGLELDLPTLAGSFAYPIKYGYAAVGRVVAMGAQATHVREGDLVFALHPHQDSFNVPVGLAHALPAGIDPLRGVFMANLETALNALLDEPTRLGERVVVIGQGVVGMLIGLLARRNGAASVIAVDRWKVRRDLAIRLGADVALGPGTDLMPTVLEITEGRGADIVYEVSGNPDALQSALELVGSQGTVVVCSWYGTKPVSLELGGRFHRQRLRIRSSQVGMIEPCLMPRWDRHRRMATVMDLLGQLPLESLVSHRVRLDDAPEAYRLLDERPDETVQVVLDHTERTG